MFGNIDVDQLISLNYVPKSQTKLDDLPSTTLIFERGNPLIPVYERSESYGIPLTRDELLYIKDSMNDFEEGRYYTSPENETFEDFLKKLKE